jgi:hypothetical protein
LWNFQLVRIEVLQLAGRDVLFHPLANITAPANQERNASAKHHQEGDAPDDK